MNILLTGGTGMLGRAIIRLYAGQHNIRFTGRNLELGAQIEQAYGASFMAAELTDRAAMAQACQRMDAVIHCAALSSPWGRREDFLRLNLQATEELLVEAGKAGVKKFIHISTSSVYFHFRSGRNYREDETLVAPFCNDYAHSKALAEQAVINSHLDSVVLRPRGIFGPGDGAIVPRILRAIRGNTLWLPSAANPLVDLTYVDNVADAALLALVKPTDKGEVFNISNAQPCRIQSLLQPLIGQLQPGVKIKTLPYGLLKPIIFTSELIHRLLPGSPEPRLTRYSAGLFHYDQTMDVSKAQSILGYSPKVSIDEGVQRYVDWYKAQTV